MAKKKTERFEDQVKRLNEIVEALDAEETVLDESMKLYEEGIEIVENCVTYLADTRKRISILQKRSDGVFEKLDIDDE
ncbi:MAG: exodeoxyribonuclease VII small subunit [Ignavibacteria bacterium]|mgnify:CR=1 FL=1|nr:MAG: exodeoxyribonuclease VII small subunit [Ignavibacteria bacterium]